MKIKEPAVAYNTQYLQGLKNQLISYIDQTTDESKLKRCLELLHGNDMPKKSKSSMPCCYTEEELDEVIRKAEASGYISHEKVLEKFAKWGYVG